jgi:AAA family ATP:ADP antiporter
VTYNLAINLVEVVWKNQIKQSFPNPSDYNIYMGQVMTAMGVIATITALFISGYVIRRFTWTFNALVTPIIMLVTGIGFFSFLLYKDSTLAAGAAAFGCTPLIMSIFFGSLQNCLSRASKYTLFDATKEFSFIPLSSEYKLKGKAAIDGVGSRLGKSGGSIIHQGLLMVFATVTASTPIIAAIFLVVVGIWIMAVVSLGKQFNSLVAKQEGTPAAAPADSKKAAEPVPEPS